MLTEIEGHPYLLAAGDCLLIPPGLRYCVKYFRDTVGYMGAFSAELLRNSGHRVLRLTAPSVLSVPVLDKVFFDELMIRLMRFSSSLSMVQSLLDVLLCQFDLIVPESGGSASSKLCTSYLERVFDRSVPFTGVAGYASALGVSPNHLNRAVKAETGRNASVWIDNARVSLARELLLDRSMSMSRAFQSVIDPTYHTSPRRRASVIYLPISPFTARLSSQMTGHSAMNLVHSGSAI